MVQTIGKFQYVSGENFEEFIKGLEQTEVAAPFMNTTPVVDISNDGDFWIITITNDGKATSSTFKLGETYDEKLPSFPHTFKSVTTKDGDKFKTETQLSESVKITRIYEFTDTGMQVHLSSDKTDVKATRIYKRL